MWKTERPTRKGNYLYGSFIKAAKVDGYIQSVNPGNTRDAIGRFAYSLSSVDFAVECARGVQARWHRTAIGNRRLLLERLADALVGLKEAIVCMIVREVGKPEWEAEMELKASIRFIEMLFEEGLEALEPQHVPELDAMMEQHPWGVTAVLGSFDRPLLSPIRMIAPALLAGNTVVFKPSRYSPAVGQLLAECIDRAKFPRGVFNLVQGRGRQVGERLITHDEVDAVHMEGSNQTAKRLRRILSDQPWKQLVTRTCARGSAIVLDDAEIDKAIYELILGSFLTSGQRRTSTCRAFITAGISDKFLQRLVAITNRLGIGQGFEPNVFLGPIAGKRLRRHFLEFLQQSVNGGMDLLTPSYPVDYHYAGFYVHPAILLGTPEHLVRDNSAASIVGPVLEVYVVKDFEEAVKLHNRVKGNTITSLFTRTVDYLHEARYVLKSQILNFNCSTVHLSARMPLPGQGRELRLSGLGSSLRRSVRSTALYQDRSTFDPLTIVPGVFWPETPTEVDEDEEITLIIDPETTAEMTGVPPLQAKNIATAAPKEAAPKGSTAPAAPPKKEVETTGAIPLKEDGKSAQVAMDSNNEASDEVIDETNNNAIAANASEGSPSPSKDSLDDRQSNENTLVSDDKAETSPTEKSLGTPPPDVLGTGEVGESEPAAPQEQIQEVASEDSSTSPGDEALTAPDQDVQDVQDEESSTEASEPSVNQELAPQTEPSSEEELEASQSQEPIHEPVDKSLMETQELVTATALQEEAAVELSPTASSSAILSWVEGESSEEQASLSQSATEALVGDVKVDLQDPLAGLGFAGMDFDMGDDEEDAMAGGISDMDLNFSDIADGAAVGIALEDD